MIYPIQTLLFLENGAKCKTLKVLDGPSGLDMARLEKQWIENKLGYPLPISIGECNYIMAKQSLSEFIEYLKVTFGMTEVTFGEAYFTLMKD